MQKSYYSQNYRAAYKRAGLVTVRFEFIEKKGKSVRKRHTAEKRNYFLYRGESPAFLVFQHGHIPVGFGRIDGVVQNLRDEKSDNQQSRFYLPRTGGKRNKVGACKQKLAYYVPGSRLFLYFVASEKEYG